MNASTETTKAAEASLTRDWINFARYYAGQYLGGRRGLIIATLAAVGVGLALNWSWLVAIGVAPLLISLAPCAVMCALGLCMSRMGGKSCSSQSSGTDSESGARASSSHRTTEAASEPVVTLSDRRADEPSDPSGDSESRVAARTERETTGGKG